MWSLCSLAVPPFHSLSCSDTPQTLTVKCAECWQERKQPSFALLLLCKLHIALSVPLHSAHSQQSQCPLTFNKTHILCNRTHTVWHERMLCATGVFIFMHARVWVSITVMNTEYPFRPLVKVMVLSRWKLSLPLLLLVNFTHYTHAFQQIHYIRSKTDFTKHFRHCPECGGVQLLVHSSWRLGADSGCLSAPLTHSRKTFLWLHSQASSFYIPFHSANSWPYPTCFYAPSVFLSSAKWAPCF